MCLKQIAFDCLNRDYFSLHDEMFNAANKINKRIDTIEGMIEQLKIDVN